MEDSEKLTALKKVYADIILNTAKEAAARIMISERNSTRFQQELASTKDEALRMVLRLKQMLDSKVKEAELTSLSQQKKIEELEAQLQEAEEIVRDLRAELRETQAELENVTKHQMHPTVEQNTKDEIEANGSFQQENRHDPSDATVHSEPDLQFESVSISDTRCPTVNGIDNGSELCMSHDHANSCYIHNPDFASIVIRRKEPELYRNGCTQRIRALERSLFDGNVTVSGNLDNALDETLAGAHEEDKEATVAANGKANIICEKEKPDELKVVKEGADLVKDQVLKKRLGFRKRKNRLSRLYSDQPKETTKESYLSAAKDSPHVLDNNGPSTVNSSVAHENEAQKDKMSPLTEVPTDATATVEQPDKLKVVKAGADLVKDQVLKKRLGFRKRKNRLSRLYSDQPKETTKESYLSAAKDSPHVLDNNDPSTVNSSVAHENEAQKDLMSPLTEVPTDATATVEQLDKLKVVKAGADLVKDQVLKKRLGFRKRKNRLSRLYSDQRKETTKESYLSAAKDSPHVLDNNDPSTVNSSVAHENEAQKDLMSPLTEVPTDATATVEQLDKLKVVKAGADLVKDQVLKKRLGFRKRKNRLSRLYSDQRKETTKESYLSAAKDSPHVLDNNDPSTVNSSVAHENEAQKDLMSPFAKAPTDATAAVEQLDKLKVVKAGADLVKDQVLKKRLGFRKRKNRLSRLYSDQRKETTKESYLSAAKDSPHVLDNNDPSTVNSSVAHENEAQKDLMSPFAKAPNDATAAVDQLGCHTNTEKGGIFLKGCSSKNKIEDDKESLDKSDLTRQESLSTESMEVPSCKDVVEATGGGSPDKMDSKVSNIGEKVSNRFENDKLLKYTFQRKRKKGSVSSGDVGCSPDNSNSKKICGEKQNGQAEPQKSCTMTESSRESRRLAQVARQLISLSEKKWWQ